MTVKCSVESRPSACILSFKKTHLSVHINILRDKHICRVVYRSIPDFVNATPMHANCGSIQQMEKLKT